MEEKVGFIMDASTAMEFFDRCLKKEAVTREEKMKILEELVAEQKAKALDKRSLGQELKGKKALYVKSKRKNILR